VRMLEVEARSGNWAHIESLRAGMPAPRLHRSRNLFLGVEVHAPYYLPGSWMAVDFVACSWDYKSQWLSEYRSGRRGLLPKVIQRRTWLAKIWSSVDHLTAIPMGFCSISMDSTYIPCRVVAYALKNRFFGRSALLMAKPAIICISSF
jgi:hypothetical protein